MRVKILLSGDMGYGGGAEGGKRDDLYTFLDSGFNS